MAYICIVIKNDVKNKRKKNKKKEVKMVSSVFKKKLERNLGIIKEFDKRMETPLARKMQVRAVVAKSFGVSEPTVTLIVTNRERWLAAEAQLKLENG